jgi:hypothetical protein
MDLHLVNSGEIAPDICRRACGGWLAIAPNGAKLSVGVTAATAEEARAIFRTTVERWIEILAAGERPA